MIAILERLLLLPVDDVMHTISILHNEAIKSWQEPDSSKCDFEQLAAENMR